MSKKKSKIKKENTGMEIHKNLGNSNKLLSGIVKDLNNNFPISIA